MDTKQYDIDMNRIGMELWKEVYLLHAKDDSYKAEIRADAAYKTFMLTFDV